MICPGRHGGYKLLLALPDATSPYLVIQEASITTQCRETNATNTGTACWPCRQRKVKCDNQQPCENCVKREHPQLCSYKPNRSSASKNNAAAAHTRKRARSPSDADDTVKDERQESWPPAIGKNSHHSVTRSLP